MSNIWLVSSRLYKLYLCILKIREGGGGRSGPVGGQDWSRDPLTKFPRKTLLTHPDTRNTVLYGSRQKKLRLEGK